MHSSWWAISANCAPLTHWKTSGVFIHLRETWTGRVGAKPLLPDPAAQFCFCPKPFTEHRECYSLQWFWSFSVIEGSFPLLWSQNKHSTDDFRQGPNTTRCVKIKQRVGLKKGGEQRKHKNMSKKILKLLHCCHFHFNLMKKAYLQLYVLIRSVFPCWRYHT